MPIKKVKQSTVKCRECDATAEDAFLEKIKGTDEYICDDCSAEAGSGTRKSSNDDDDDDSDDYGDAGYDDMDDASYEDSSDDDDY